MRAPVVVLGVVLALSGAGAGPATAGEDGDDEAKRLVSQLSDDDYARREEATARLSEAGRPALSAVLAAAAGDDPEAAMRARKVLEACYDSFEPALVGATRGAILDLLESGDPEPARCGERLYSLVVSGARRRSRDRLAALGQDLGSEDGPLEAFRLGEAWRGTDRDLWHLARFPEIVRLDVSNREVGDAFMTMAPRFPNVEKLYLGHTRIGEAGLRHLSAMPALTYLSLQGLAIGNAEAEQVAALKRLEHLGFDFTKVTDDGLAHVRNLENLETLWLNGLAIDGPGLRHLEGLPKLKRLVLAKSPFDDEGMAFLPALKQVTELGLDDTKITDAGMPHLEALGQLEKLWINRTAVSDQSIPTLSKLSNLRRLYIPGCEFTEEGIAKLREALPGCTVTTE